MSAFFGGIDIRYQEPDPSTYTEVGVRTRDLDGKYLERRKFATGDANYDYHCAMIWLEHQGCETVIGSSSCEHFVMDGGILDPVAIRSRLLEYQKSL